MSLAVPYLALRECDWLVDTCTWLNLAAAPRLALAVMRGCGPRLRIPHMVVEELGERANGLLSPLRTATQVDMTVPEMRDWYELITAHWDREAARNRGEAACIAIATSRRWSLLMDDGVAVRVSVDRGLPVMRTANLLVSGAAAEWWTPLEAWEGFQQMVSARRNRLGPELWDWTSLDDFLRVCAAETARLRR